MEVAVTPPPAIDATMPVVSTEREDRRRDRALWMLFGGAMTMTALSLLSLIAVRNNATHAFWLGMAAHAQVVIVLSAIGGLLVKRKLELSREGLKLDDRD